MAAPNLNPEEYQFLDTGILLNGDSSMPFVDVTSVDGLDNVPVRQSITSREGMHGAWVDATFEDARTVTIEGNIYAQTTDVEEYLDLLKANFAPSAQPQAFYFGTDSGDVRCVFGKSLGIRYAKGQQRRLGIVPFQVQIVCEDPRIYAAVETSVVLPTPLTLSGNRESMGYFTIDGPRDSTSITLNGSVLSLTASVPVGFRAIIDLSNKVAYMGTTNLRAYLGLPSGWPTFQQGINTLNLGGSGTGIVTAVARSAWW